MLVIRQTAKRKEENEAEVGIGGGRGAKAETANVAGW